MDDVFSATWWRRDVAIAWVLTRDREFTQARHISGPGMIALEIEHAMHAPSDRDWTQREAWERLRQEAISRPIRTIGNPVERFDNGDGAALETPQPARDISDLELESLIPHQVGADEYLVDEDWRVSRGSDWRNVRGYSNVRMRAADVLAAFPEGSDPKPVVAGSTGNIEDVYRQWVAKNDDLLKQGKLKKPPEREECLAYMRGIFGQDLNRKVVLKPETGLRQRLAKHWRNPGRPRNEK